MYLKYIIYLHSHCPHHLIMLPQSSIWNKLTVTNSSRISPQCVCLNVLNLFHIARQLVGFSLFFIINKLCLGIKNSVLLLQGHSAYLGGFYLQIASTCLRLQKSYNHAFGLIRSQAELLIVWRKQDLEGRYSLELQGVSM